MSLSHDNHADSTSWHDLGDEIAPFDHQDPQLADTLHERLADLRERCPVAHSTAHDGFWLLTRQDDVTAVAKDGATFSASVRGLGAAALFPGSENTVAPLFESDPPVHTRWRKVLQPFFTLSAVQAHEPFIRQLTDQVIGALAPRGQCDVVSDLAALIPTVVIGEVMGVPRQRHHELAQLGLGLMAPTSEQHGREAATGLVDFLRREIAERRGRVAYDSDPLTAVVHAVVDDRRATDDELLKHAFIMFSAGFTTTVDTISNLMLLLAQDPATRQRVIDQPELVTELIEETVRHEPPIVATARTVLVPTTLRGVDLDVGDRLMLAWASACRDEQYVTEPAQFRLDRPRQGRDPGWGAGVHRCMGTRLARLQLRIVVEKVLAAIPEFAVAPDTTPQRTTGVLRGVRHLRLIWPV
ncbi:Cytochrome P450 [Lentzea xinjiangensis]|uniref:Cytochrome P450 n=1 Tax=Lentzea xinjiangensis TaxID=402600 RepID=A0A1H9W9X2_9PSEU|nr:cytochrome P450 [Lentzea xinjiangensis]SES30273.1 Cytochrome P450 [Lentzea xinjiangensis]